jgi:hypothetical protein
MSKQLSCALLMVGTLIFPLQAKAQDEPLPPNQPAAQPQPTAPSAEPPLFPAPAAPAQPTSPTTSSPQPLTPAPPPAKGVLEKGPILQPQTQYWFPVESGALDSHVDLQLMYSYASMSFMERSTSFQVVLLGLEAQYALWDRLEAGLNLPFLQHAAVNSLGGSTSTDTEFGNISINLKGKIYGDSKGSLAISAFMNTILPTGTGLPSRDFAYLHIGGAASAALSIVTFGAATGVFWGINGKGKDVAVYLFDIHSGVRIHPMFAAYLAFQFAEPVYPNTSDLGFAISPGVQFFPIPALHIDLGARIAATDNGEALYNFLGRAALLFGVGYTI